MEEANAHFANQISVVNNLTCIQYIYTKRDHLPENILQNQGFSLLMYLMTFHHRCIWTYMNLTHELLYFQHPHVSFSVHITPTSALFLIIGLI